MQINYKKSLKLVILLITSLLIATASATIYDYMYLNGNVGVEGMSLAWVLGPDNSTAGAQINGVTGTLTNLKGPPNGTRIYADPIRLNNTGGSTITFNVTIASITNSGGVGTSALNSTYVKIYSLNTSALMGTVTVWENGGQGSDVTGLSIPANHMWRFQWEITWKSTATTSDSIAVNLKIQVPVA
jgi:hypothetical protein